MISRGTIVVEGNRVIAVGAEVDVPEGAKILDLQGRSNGVDGFIVSLKKGDHFVSNIFIDFSAVVLDNLGLFTDNHV